MTKGWVARTAGETLTPGVVGNERSPVPSQPLVVRGWPCCSGFPVYEIGGGSQAVGGRREAGATLSRGQVRGIHLHGLWGRWLCRAGHHAGHEMLPPLPE